ncbi:D-Ala-D-Ala carboxypeptidase family metallohydrolase [Streptomyces iconiensis]|uniref:D-Ala-D-Ala carboxypeptidase family metallohydrolase n=1 Tax=Streptomyces iconiensis TaxID=1384038 RepID=A0ABT7A506_9ACTN|nr:D-Ala-D-Ala carboxypeptidase family metallohydrolase [Streptomyces iconiensis]MDJ1136427.1 D-Ala-D-Ala carboxypeptidase family metallohydrolase [Streptomyces iconiensis]
MRTPRPGRTLAVPLRLVLAVTLLAATVLTGTAAAATAPRPAADGCYTWQRDLAEGATGEDVRQLQVRVAGYPAPGEVIAMDGDFGPATKAAVVRFQKAYGLTAGGKADGPTYEKIYALQDDDCSPAHFTFSELNDCNSDWSGGAVSAAQAKSSALRTMWKLEALRHALGDKPITVTSGFRSKACNDQVGGAPSSRHLYGDAADLGAGPHSLCTLAKAARDRGFHGILGPGYPGHDDHTHLDHRASRFWSAPTCGIG